MTMQRRHFELIAETISELPKYGKLSAEARDYVAKCFSADLAMTNPNFDRARFLRACGVEVQS